MKPEFKIGDKITFHPYEKRLPAVVKGIRYGNPWVENDDRIFYEISGPMCLSVTTGKNIEESYLYDNFPTR